MIKEKIIFNPEIEIISTEEGAGAVVRPIINDGKLIDTVVINSGIGYNQATTQADC